MTEKQAHPDRETSAYIRTLHHRIELLDRRQRALEGLLMRSGPADTDLARPSSLMLPVGPLYQERLDYRGVIADAMTIGEIDDRWDGEDPRPLEVFPGWSAISRVGEASPTFGFDIRNVEGIALERLIERIAENLERLGSFFPVFIYHCADLSAFRRRGFFVEVIPDFRGLATDTDVPAQSYEAFVRRRLAFIRRKYQLARIFDLSSLPQGDQVLAPDLNLATFAHDCAHAPAGDRPLDGEV